MRMPPHCKLHKRKPARSLLVTVQSHVYAFHRSDLRKQASEVCHSRAEREITDVQRGGRFESRYLGIGGVVVRTIPVYFFLDYVGTQEFGCAWGWGEGYTILYGAVACHHQLITIRTSETSDVYYGFVRPV